MCIFCKIIKKEISGDVVYEDDDILAIKDIKPIAPIHFLIVPKKHIESIDDLEEGDTLLVGKMIILAKKLAREFDISEKGYRLMFRVGEWGGQEVPHIHLHLIGGSEMHEDIHPI